MNKKIEVSPVFYANYEAYKSGKYRIIANQGGTSSTKTYSIMQLLKCIADTSSTSIEVAALTVPHYKSGALQDFKNILTSLDELNSIQYNKTDQVFTLRTSTVKFSAYDTEQKARGPRRDILFVNEANLIDPLVLKQLMLRTRKAVFLDYNPADEFCPLYDLIDSRSDCKLIISTYLDGYDFLSPETIAEIETLRDVDPDLWKVYGLGQRGVGRNKIYTNYTLVDSFPLGRCELSYGLDFGFNNPSCLMLCGLYDDNVYWDELIYEKGLTTPLLIEKMKQIHVDRDIPLYCDSAEPDRISELNEAGFNAKPANKSVKAGIDFIRGIDEKQKQFKARRLFITKRSHNAIKEIKQYKNKEVKGVITDEPVKFMDHAMDAGRYGSYTHYLSLITETNLSQLGDLLQNAY